MGVCGKMICAGRSGIINQEMLVVSKSPISSEVVGLRFGSGWLTDLGGGNSRSLEKDQGRRTLVQGRVAQQWQLVVRV